MVPQKCTVFIGPPCISIHHAGVAACAKSHVFANNKLKGWG